MSLAIQSAAPRRAPARPQPAIQLVESPQINRRALGKATKNAMTAFGIGILSIVLAGLFVNIMISQGVYQLSGIKAEMKDLTTNNQILGEQVRSLSSDQNLANAASHLGMVTNANPVYLRLSDGKVIGRTQVAVANSGVRIGKNVVPNAALVSVTTKAALEASTEAASLASQAAKTAAAASQAASKRPVSQVKTTSPSTSTASTKTANVAAAETAAKTVVLASSGIPVSPTH